MRVCRPPLFKRQEFSVVQSTGDVGKILGEAAVRGSAGAITSRFTPAVGDGTRWRVVGGHHTVLNGLPWSVQDVRGGIRPLDRWSLYGKAVRRSVSHTGEIAIDVCAFD